VSEQARQVSRLFFRRQRLWVPDSAARDPE
jgi:hypothetical protein